MPLLFTRICDLLSPIEDLSNRDPPLLPARLRHRTNEVIRAWFASHQVSLHSQDIDAVALLSTLFPAKRTDRVYGVQAPRLGRCLRRWLNLGSGRWPLLDQWQQPGRGDLGDCVERVLKQAEHPEPLSKDKVTLEEIDNALENVASRCRFSAPAVRARGIENDTEVSNALENIYKKLHSRDAKWFTRLFLKDFSSLALPDNLIYSHIDPRLSVALRMYNDFESAVCELRNLPASQMVDTAHGGFTKHCANDIHLLHPRIGVKVSAPTWLKAKGGIKHAVSVIDGRTMSVERKYDGEYCQIHVDLSKGENCIQIFSKSGKDSTEDRRGVHKAIKDSLRIGFDDCKFSEKCVLEGELLVYSDRARDILGFHKIRKHVSRSGSFLGTALDSQPHHWEHLMIAFCDILLVDDEPILHDPYEIRRQRLKKLVTSIEGRANLSQRIKIDFSQPRGVDGLKNALASAFAQRWEGLVLKPADESYFDLKRSCTNKFSSRWIKLKKDCIKGLGDTTDFAVIGAGYDVTKATNTNIANLRWTHFYIGCLRNKSAVIHSGAKPQFFIFDQVSDCLKKKDLKSLNNLGHLRSVEPDSAEARDLFNIEYAMGLPQMKTVFRSPFVFDVAGSGFDKSPNRDIFTLRFPRIMRVHWDRDWKESVSLDELQEIAAQAVEVPSEEIRLEEKLLWVKRLDELDKMPKGKLSSWDYSDGEEDDIDFTPSEGPIAVTSVQRLRSRTPAVPFLVRIDTSEMKDRERRLDTGEVVERSTPQDSMASTTTAGSLQTPPHSSPLPNVDSEVRGQKSPLRAIGHAREKTSKRSAAVADMQVSPRQLKKSRSELQQHQRLGSSTGSPKLPHTAFNKRPLHEITNSAKGVRPPSPRSISKAKEFVPKDAFLVRKLPAGADEDIHHRYKKKRRIEEVSSYSQETTASERSTTTTSQRTDPPELGHAPLKAPMVPESNPQILPTPPSTAAQSLNINLPDLKECKIVLSPSLIQNHVPIAPLKAILGELSISPSSLRLALQSPKSNNILYDTLNATTQIILLVDPDSQATVDHIRELIKNVPKWHPIPLAIWDWQVLHILTEEDPAVETEEDELLVRSLFFARLRWETGLEGKGAVEVTWRDGLVTMVPEERLEDFGMGMRRVQERTGLKV